VLLLTDIDQAQHAADRAHALIEAVSVPHQAGGHTIDITVSVGVSIYPDDGHEATMLLLAADAAMYQAKERGRNTCQFFTAEMNARAIARQTVEAGLRRALTRQELVLHSQPKIALDTGAVTGVEALMRWRDPDRGLIGPTDFVCSLTAAIEFFCSLTELIEFALSWAVPTLFLGNVMAA